MNKEQIEALVGRKFSAKTWKWFQSKSFQARKGVGHDGEDNIDVLPFGTIKQQNDVGKLPAVMIRPI